MTKIKQERDCDSNGGGDPSLRLIQLHVVVPNECHFHPPLPGTMPVSGFVSKIISPPVMGNIAVSPTRGPWALLGSPARASG
jgi:hypothetical protein